MDNQPKISTTEAILLIIGALFVDIVPIILILVGLPDFFLPGLFGFVTQIYFRMKGVPSGLDLITSIAELIPYIDALPMKTIGIAITIWIDRHPEGRIAQLTQKAAQAVPMKGSKAPTLAPGIKTPIGGLKKAA